MRCWTTSICLQQNKAAQKEVPFSLTRTQTSYAECQLVCLSCRSASRRGLLTANSPVTKTHSIWFEDVNHGHMAKNGFDCAQMGLVKNDAMDSVGRRQARELFYFRNGGGNGAT